MQQPLDNLLTTLDRALRSVLASPVAARPMPGADLPEAALSDAERREAASLMRVNHAGVMPIIFASSLMIFPSAIFGWMRTRAFASGSPDWWQETTNFLALNFEIGAYPYIVFEIALIYFFSYFWTTVQFSPDDMAKQLKEHGSFIPGLRPGPRTAEYLETVMERITYVGAGFLALIAVIPTVVSDQLGIPFFVSQFLGGTGLLIVVSVGLDLIQRIEANLLMRNYSGFLSRSPADRSAPRVRSARG